MKLYDFISNDYRELISNHLLNHIMLNKHYCTKKRNETNNKQNKSHIEKSMELV